MTHYIIVFLISMVPLIELRGSMISASSGICDRHHREHAAGTDHIFLCPKSAHLGGR